MVLPIRAWPDPVLTQPCEPWNFDQPPMPADRLEQDLIDTMLSAHGLGLAANQVGIGYRVLAQQLAGNSQVLIMYNPRAVSVSEDLWTHDEGCLSFPGVWLEIARPRTVVAEWQQRDGSVQQQEFTEMDAKCFLHELEHLNGQVFKDQVSKLKFDRARKRANKK